MPDWPTVEIVDGGSSPPHRLLTVHDSLGPYPGALITLHTNQRGRPVAIDQGFTDQRGEIWVYGAQQGDTLRAASIVDEQSGSVSVMDATNYTITMSALASLQALAVPDVNPYLTLFPSSDGESLHLSLPGLGPGATLVAIVTQSGGTASQSTSLAYSSSEGAYVGSVVFSSPYLQQGTGTAQVLGVEGNSQGINLSTTYALQAVPVDRMADLYSADGNLHVHLITGTLQADAYAVLHPLNAAPTVPPTGLQVVGTAYNVKFSGAAPLSQPALLKLHYDMGLIDLSVRPSELGVFWWSPAHQSWQAVPDDRLDEDQEAVVAPVTIPGIYALLAPRHELLENAVFLPVIFKGAP
jgi:hypothetical protein